MNVAAALQLIASLAAALGAYGLYKALRFIYVNRTSPLRHLPGPPKKGFIWGNLKEIMDSVRLEIILCFRLTLFRPLSVVLSNLIYRDRRTLTSMKRG
jgi:hypothetical protein